jgi:hypothetical protein
MEHEKSRIRAEDICGEKRKIQAVLPENKYVTINGYNMIAGWTNQNYRRLL